MFKEKTSQYFSKLAHNVFFREKYAKFGRCFITFKDQQSKATFLKDYKPSFIDEKGIVI